jgi:hypothetical protein
MRHGPSRSCANHCRVQIDKVKQEESAIMIVKLWRGIWAAIVPAGSAAEDIGDPDTQAGTLQPDVERSTSILVERVPRPGSSTSGGTQRDDGAALTGSVREGDAIPAVVPEELEMAVRGDYTRGDADNAEQEDITTTSRSDYHGS